MIIYQHDECGYFTGQSKDVHEKQAIPYRWSKVPMQEIPEGKFAQLNGTRWDMVDEKVYLPPPIPDVVTMRQARLALLGAGLLSQVETALNSLEEPHRSAALIEWEYAQEVKRDYPWVSQMVAVMGLTDEQVDDLFRAAAAL